MSELSGRRTSAAAAIRFACSSAGILFGEPFGNHSKFQVVIRMTAPSPSDEASETNARINAITGKKVRGSMCGAGEEGYPTVNVASLAAKPARNRCRWKVCRRGFARAPEAGWPNPVGGPPWDPLFLRALIYRRSLAGTRLGNVRLGPDPLPSLRRVP